MEAAKVFMHSIYSYASVVTHIDTRDQEELDIAEHSHHLRNNDSCGRKADLYSNSSRLNRSGASVGIRRYSYCGSKVNQILQWLLWRNL